MNAIVYNPSSPDSTIAAALLASADDYHCQAISGGNFQCNHASYTWVGVKPLPEHRQRINYQKTPVEHRYYGLEPLTEKERGEYSFVRCLDELAVEEEHLQPAYSLLEVIAEPQVPYQGHHEGAIWQIGMASHKFMSCSPKMTMDEQVLLWVNYVHALDCMETGNRFKLITVVTGQMTTQYLQYLTSIKTRLQRAWSISQVQIGKDYEIMPVLNMEVDAVAWAIKLTACSHNRCVVFDVRNGRSHVTIFTRENDMDQLEAFFNKSADAVTTYRW